MKIRALRVENFKGIQRVDMRDLGDVITVAGRNGCGKTCLLEAIRLLKTQYGHYNENENRAWWDEKQIDVGQPGWARKVLRDKKRGMTIEGEIELAPQEKDYVREDENNLG